MRDENEDSRLRYMAATWVHEHAWGRPKEYDPASEKPAGPKFNPRDYSPEQLDVIEAALRLMLNPPRRQPQEPEVIEPGSGALTAILAFNSATDCRLGRCPRAWGPFRHTSIARVELRNLKSKLPARLKLVQRRRGTTDMRYEP
jgi:hypothetical protein